jgi:hypothetical protein
MFTPPLATRMPLPIAEPESRTPAVPMVLFFSEAVSVPAVEDVD